MGRFFWYVPRLLHIWQGGPSRDSRIRSNLRDWVGLSFLNYLRLPRAGVDISTHHSFPGPQHRPYMPGLFQAHYFYPYISIREHGVSFTASPMQPPEMAAIVAAVWGKKHILQTQEST
jgi:hypothetical protein